MPGGWISVISRPTREVPEMRDLPGLNGAWTEERQENAMTFTNIALSLIGVAILALIPCGCILTRSSHKQPQKPSAH